MRQVIASPLFQAILKDIVARLLESVAMDQANRTIVLQRLADLETTPVIDTDGDGEPDTTDAEPHNPNAQ